MDDEKILKKIQDSAENVEIPESLKPEAIKKKLEKLQQEKQEPGESREKERSSERVEKQGTGKKQEEKTSKKVIHLWRRRAAQAAAAFVVLIGAGALAKTGILDRGNTQTVSESAEVDAGTAQTEDAASENEAVQAENAASESEAAQGDETTAAVRAAETAEAAEEQSLEDSAAESGIQCVASYRELYDFLRAYEEEESSSDLDTGVVYSAEMALESLAAASDEDTTGSSASSDAAAGADNDAVESVSEAEDISVEEAAVTQESTASFSGTGSGDSADYSTTNTQEEGVDEADIVKTDGKYLYALGSDGVLRIVDAADLTLTASLTVGDGTGDVKEIYLDGTVLQVIRQSMEYVSVQGSVDMSDGSSVRSWYDYPVTRTTVVTYDVSDPENPGRQGTYSQDGSYLTSRRNGGCLYLFTSYSPDTGAESEEEEYFVPNVGGGLLPCEDIYYLGDQSEITYNGGTFLVAGSVKDGTPDEAADRMAVVGGGDTFYVSQENIYAASGFWSDGERKTGLVRFGYEDGVFTPGASCQLDGYLNDNFSMDEYQNHLRLVLTTDRTVDEGELEITSYEESNHLYILDEGLEVTGRIRNLAKGETIQSARFMGDTGYFVTYRNTDPLFSVDLSDPENPKVLGELEVTGFSAYLHAYGSGQLLGLGWETDPDTGERLGLKCSLFDISDPTAVKETDRLVLGDVDGCNAVDRQYKAILVNADRNLFGFAYEVLKDDDSWEYQYYYGLFTCDGETGIRALEYIKVPEEIVGAEEEYQNLRGLYIGDTFYLVGDGGVESYDMASEDFRVIGSLCWEE